MRASGCRGFRKMDMQCSIFKLLLFQMVVVRCTARLLPANMPRVELRGDLKEEVQDSIRNLIHTGIYSHKHLDTSQVQVVAPVKVTWDGELVSHVLSHAHEHGHARARRDLHATEHALPHSLHYNLTVDGRDLRLDLRPSVTFITPALVVERHSVRGRTRERPQESATACHYTGTVRGQPGSAVAISACDGLAGQLRTEHGEYWIEPSKHKPTDGSPGHPHIIFKRSAVDKVKAFHRRKREVEHGRSNSYTNLSSNNNENKMKQNYRRAQKEIKDRRRRKFLEGRRRRLEALRNDPAAYRRHKKRLRMEGRRLQPSSASASSSRSVSVENSKSLEQGAKVKSRPHHKRKRIQKNCATKQPSYQWKERNFKTESEDSKKDRNNKVQGFQTRLGPRRAHNKLSQKSNRSQDKQQNRHNDPLKRAQRSVSKPRHVEVLLVADKSMTEFHKQGELEKYLLTIMNIVSSLYMDPSIGNYIKVVVVKIVLVEEYRAAPDLNITTNADDTLSSFCRWQHQLNPQNDKDPHHHDVAILVTREDICSQHDTPCSTLGVAHVAGMCKPDRSCSVNEDNGIMLAHTITHELGHNFGLYHDTVKIGCNRREGATLHIMTPIFEADTVQVAWSRCSKRDVTNFLDAGLGECLSDRPSQEEPYVYPEVPAGVTFDAASQCHLQFGAEAVVCAKPEELCEHLWCFVNNTCKTMLRPAAPGTTCGENMWCQNLTCVARTPSPVPRNGGWGPWSEWSECSRTCGAGVSTQSRECNNPEPLNNGNYCIGDRSRYKVCNTDPCPINEPTFREVQCAKFNNMEYNNETITEWIPYIDQDRPCELQCVPHNRNDVEMIGVFVADGTPCRQIIGARDMCIAGICYKVGCDWIVDSDVEEDECGVCGGNGSDCKTVQGIYNKDTTRQSGFSEVAVIPAGSRNVKIQEKVSPGNYISIGSAKSRKIYLNGARNATLTEYFVAGTQAIYERDRDWEKVRIVGPLTEDIKVYVSYLTINKIAMKIQISKYIKLKGD
ncbi:A disintegrin and metalloproteinase with thrombospondin motifs 7 isoform X1 [Bicyclus anynana]|uniref:A disintegrin and metalloproteinase with thrombospondin motifs 7 isoform X1 n=1 Tax=Bicyclus anynana TaxID=110368 RepID=A0ABM3LU69_BICAN|nr:A disintegrin and metalloproteinase with thrombospondin motifs 7 isoform X1 [Bicyclus anynana]XP_052742618.1 A disintegrin and metalloproteinase with thrombospondin motifs 7 isoform X1 [Bicyclus anynana]XP_052742619.1 A disintegrin and metalloproteinase with thrombospondin motifs 7 isoform X1 [Bicyclus anynana]